MTVLIGPFSRPPSSSPAHLTAPPTRSHGPSFADLFKGAAPPPGDDFARSFESAGMFGRGLEVVSETAHPALATGKSVLSSQIPASASPSDGGPATPTLLLNSLSVAASSATSPRALEHAISQATPPTMPSGPPLGNALPSALSRPTLDRTLALDESIATGSCLPKATISGSESSVWFAVKATESGLRIQARVSRLDDDERERLRDDIVSLLNAHGIASDGVVLNEAEHIIRSDHQE